MDALAFLQRVKVARIANVSVDQVGELDAQTFDQCVAYYNAVIAINKKREAAHESPIQMV